MDFAGETRQHGQSAQVRSMASFNSEKPSFYTTQTSRSNTEDEGPSNHSKREGRQDFDTISHVELVHRTKSHDSNLPEGQILTPAPTRDPRDPLNMTLKRKMIAVFCLCFFGAMAAAAELILGAMLPVFVLEYAGIDTRTVAQLASIPLPAGTNPLALLTFFGGPPIEKVYLLGSLPVLMIGLSNLVMIPVATAVGRRPVLLSCGILAVAGCVWSGHSQSLDSHLAARCLQAIGAGTVESLIPFVISDLTFSHERNTWMSFVFAAQGVIIVGLGFGTPYIIVDLSWRWLYFITAIGAGIFLLGVAAFLPETRWYRSPEEMKGIPRDERLFATAPRTLRYNLAIFHGERKWRAGLQVFIDAIYTLFYPQILFITLLNSAMIGATFAAGYTAAEPLLVKPWAWPFQHLTLCLIPVLLASIGTVLITGRVADIVCNWGARRRANGKRVPEDQLLNLMLPTLCGIAGTIMFALAGGDPSRYSWGVFLTGLGFMAFGFLGANTVGAVYVLEVYPSMGGSALLNVASIRYIIAFILSFRISAWIVDLGYLKSFLIYAIPMVVFAFLIPPLWYFGPSWKAKFPGRVSTI